MGPAIRTIIKTKQNKTKKIQGWYRCWLLSQFGKMHTHMCLSILCVSGFALCT